MEEVGQVPLEPVRRDEGRNAEEGVPALPFPIQVVRAPAVAVGLDADQLPEDVKPEQG